MKYSICKRCAGWLQYSCKWCKRFNRSETDPNGQGVVSRGIHHWVGFRRLFGKKVKIALRKSLCYWQFLLTKVTFSKRCFDKGYCWQGWRMPRIPRRYVISDTQPYGCDEHELLQCVGVHCETRVYDCTVHSCANNATCRPTGPLNYTCDCRPNHYGDYCQFATGNIAHASSKIQSFVEIAL